MSIIKFYPLFNGCKLFYRTINSFLLLDTIFLTPVRSNNDKNAHKYIYTFINHI